MSIDFNPNFITKLHKEAIERWKATGINYQHSGIYQLAEENHAFNYQLWHAEDRARRDDMGAEYVYLAKREIDGFNQQRNNRMEAMDEWFFNYLKPAGPHLCPVHSETPGMMIDRLSILSLKSYHMRLQTLRSDASEEHKNSCAKKLETIDQQLEQLSRCLGEFVDEVEQKIRTFRVYHQFKMYNDPNLNPELYSTQK
ncbi:DUF4254 domain-containing protein [Legionella sp. km772]|uniref:DUF4254 domain-containing protein n=1 Tax=Legionella sp. km772 TaxID=2498111 RepID=UPI000F8D164B|nr:DUF4254 domain-containing protein [Legionella sp. km772]RUR13524.1 DUF4254 domain-containing protein [Legionella sp. km772]